MAPRNSIKANDLRGCGNKEVFEVVIAAAPSYALGTAARKSQRQAAA